MLPLLNPIGLQCLNACATWVSTVNSVPAVNEAEELDDEALEDDEALDELDEAAPPPPDEPPLPPPPLPPPPQPARLTASRERTRPVAARGLITRIAIHSDQTERTDIRHEKIGGRPIATRSPIPDNPRAPRVYGSGYAIKRSGVQSRGSFIELSEFSVELPAAVT
jgi:hypothetical protein